jgi:hypothetical protein
MLDFEYRRILSGNVLFEREFPEERYLLRERDFAPLRSESGFDTLAKMSKAQHWIGESLSLRDLLQGSLPFLMSGVDLRIILQGLFDQFSKDNVFIARSLLREQESCTQSYQDSQEKCGLCLHFINPSILYFGLFVSFSRAKSTN